MTFMSRLTTNTRRKTGNHLRRKRSANPAALVPCPRRLNLHGVLLCSVTLLCLLTRDTAASKTEIDRSQLVYDGERGTLRSPPTIDNACTTCDGSALNVGICTWCHSRKLNCTTKSCAECGGRWLFKFGRCVRCGGKGLERCIIHKCHEPRKTPFNALNENALGSPSERYLCEYHAGQLSTYEASTMSAVSHYAMFKAGCSKVRCNKLWYKHDQCIAAAAGEAMKEDIRRENREDAEDATKGPGVRVRGAGDASANGWYSLRENDGTIPMAFMEFPVTPLCEATLLRTQWMDFSQGQPWFCKSSPHAEQCYIWWSSYNKAWILNKGTRPEYHSQVPSGLPEQLPSVWEAVQCSPFGRSMKTTTPKMRQYQYTATPVVPAKSDPETTMPAQQRADDYTKSSWMLWGAYQMPGTCLLSFPESAATQAVEAVIATLDESQPGWRSRFNKNWRVDGDSGRILTPKAGPAEEEPEWRSVSKRHSDVIVNGVKVDVVRSTATDIANGKKVLIIKETRNGNTTTTTIETDLGTGKITRTVD